MNYQLPTLEIQKEPTMLAKAKHLCSADHAQVLLAMHDAMNVLSGKWKMQIITILLVKDKMRFMDLLRSVNGIGAKMLSRELQDLEMNKLITRTVQETKPVTVEYQITAYGKTLEGIILEIVEWGIQHRKTIMKE